MTEKESNTKRRAQENRERQARQDEHDRMRDPAVWRVPLDQPLNIPSESVRVDWAAHAAALREEAARRVPAPSVKADPDQPMPFFRPRMKP